MSVPEEVLRDRISRIIAATRFPFIDQATWDEDRSTLVNTRIEKVYAVATAYGVHYPSIVVTKPDGSIRELGVVEMSVEPHLVEKWRVLSEITGMGEKYKKLFIYVPNGKGSQALELIEDQGIEYAGLREWSIENGILSIRPIKTPDMEYDHRVS